MDPKRYESLDQFRGWSVASMLLVSFLGYFRVMPEMFRHHLTGFSFADAVAPFFIFIVGAGFRLSFLRSAEINGVWDAKKKAFVRFLLLTVIGIFFYGPDFRINIWDALVDIGLAGILMIPFINSSAFMRFGMATLYLLVFQCVSDWTPYGAWLFNRGSIDGGPLGPLSWVFPLAWGTLVADWYWKNLRTSQFIRNALGYGTFLTILGYALSSFWPFSQRAMTCSYSICASGASILVLLAFYIFADVWRRPLPHLSLLGRHALVIYLVQNVLISSWRDARGLFNKDTGMAVALLGFMAIYYGCYSIARYLDKNRYFIKF
ncbi:MAG: heparan-alpha-glucosaminide N-acetyltransferase domain-containing protein [bacterium]|nr:heparan-alpha-glucosaminide N-acetyltransferase domain-containing protein [bacterium]